MLKPPPPPKVWMRPGYAVAVAAMNLLLLIGYLTGWFGYSEPWEMGACYLLAAAAVGCALGAWIDSWRMRRWVRKHGQAWMLWL